MTLQMLSLIKRRLSLRSAIKAFLKAVELDPKVPYYHLNLAKLYEQVGRPKLAKEHYEQYEHFKGESPQ